MPEPLDLTDPGPLLATTHVLEDAPPARLRLTRPSDAPLVESFLEDLSAGTRARRFLEPVEVTPELVRGFTFYNPRERIVVAATMPVEGTEAIAGLADVTLKETGLAEMGVVVADELQERGLGTLLVQSSASLALQKGATHLRVETLDGGGPMLRVMERLGRVQRTVEAGRITVYARIAGARRRAS